jgi:fibronectin-binding autotransporter adhesin
MSERQRWFGIFLAKAILVCGCVPFALYGQVTATWTGGGGDSSWSDGNNWSWDNSACQGPSNSPGTFIDNTSPCYTANVMIGGGFTVNVNVQFMSVVQNLTIGSSAFLYGTVNPEGTATIGSGAYVSGGVFAAGVLTNQGTIVGGASGGPVNNNNGATIKLTGGLNTYGPGTNAGTIEATGTGSYGGGSAGLSGNWNNAGGTIQIDSGATLVCDATITNGNLIDNGGSVSGAGDGLTIAGTVNSTSLTIDAPGGPTTVTITGALYNTGTLTLGQTGGTMGSVSTLMVNGGALNVTGGNTIIGVNAGSTGQLEISGTSALKTTTGNLIIGSAGSGYVYVSGGAALTAGVVTIGSQPSGNGQLNVGGMGSGTVNYATLNAVHGSTMFGGVAISITSNGSLFSVPNQQSNGSPADNLSGIAQVYGTWKSQNGIVVQGGGSLTVSDGGAVSVSCTSCRGSSSAFQVLANSKVSVVQTSTPNIAGGTASSLTATSIGVAAGGSLTLEYGATAYSPMVNVNGAITVQGMDALLTTMQRITEQNPYASGRIYISGAGIVTVQNQGQITAAYITLDGPADKLVAQSNGEVLTNVLSVLGGGTLLQNGGFVSMPVGKEMGFIPPYGSIDIGGETWAGTLTVSGGAVLGAGYVSILRNGTLRVTNGSSVQIFPILGTANVSFEPGTPPGTIDVSNGALGIGLVGPPPFSSSPAAIPLRQGWVTVGPEGHLYGGKV